MTIRTRLTLWFTGLLSALLLVFCLVLYTVAERHREREFRERLRAEAQTSVGLLFGRETISPELFKLLDRNHMTVLPDEEIIIYDSQNHIRYESGTDYLAVDRTTLDRVRVETDVYWREKDREIVGTAFTAQGNRFVVFASAVDTYGFSKQRDLAWLLAVGWLVVTGGSFGVGRFLAGRSLQPMRRVIGRIDGISATQLDQRLPTGADNDEIDQLSERFNRMLDRLEAAFRMQQAFVSHASHELRTPLTAMSGQLEVSLLTDEEPAELRETLRSVLDDVRGMTRLTNGLLSLAKVGVDASAVRMTRFALDELLWKVRDEVRRLHAGYQITVSLDTAHGDQPTDWQLTASEPLIHTALLNLFENGGKFSPTHHVTVNLGQQADTLQLRIHNDGPPIPADELPKLFAPFQRGTNAQGIPGHGVGLSLTQRIIQLHNGRLDVTSSTEQGTTFTVTLPQNL
ncbi:histidine kinase [Fibrella aestuarina BUZ 2]|uniref:histidine kinase n=1 Tax=Fibrella aestuarina BUZ 2 TaxID=1166018 RepID=I0KB38_9BACT|nr:ATP-binding protein [Fibrella aestuarina]CCH01341.1 histidine kinase [Fibrella aestuarina BUZ 2]